MQKFTREKQGEAVWRFYFTPVKWLRRQTYTIGGDCGGLGTAAEGVH